MNAQLACDVPLDTGVAGASTAEELDVWKLADEVESKVRVLLGRPAMMRDFTLWRQLKRSSESPCPNISEGFSRFYPRDFARFVRIARGSLSETIVHMSRARTKGLTSVEETAEIIKLADRGRKAAAGLIRYLETAKPPNQPPRRRQSRQKPSKPDA